VLQSESPVRKGGGVEREVSGVFCAAGAVLLWELKPGAEGSSVQKRKLVNAGCSLEEKRVYAWLKRKLHRIQVLA
jgi:hypothetical protein